MKGESETAVLMLRHMAVEIERENEESPPVVAVVIIALRADGSWGAMSSMSVDPFAGTALLEFAKHDLLQGGSRWTQFQPAADAANEPIN